MEFQTQVQNSGQAIARKHSKTDLIGLTMRQLQNLYWEELKDCQFVKECHGELVSRGMILTHGQISGGFYPMFIQAMQYKVDVDPKDMDQFLEDYLAQVNDLDVEGCTCVANTKNMLNNGVEYRFHFSHSPDNYDEKMELEKEAAEKVSVVKPKLKTPVMKQTNINVFMRKN